MDLVQTLRGPFEKLAYEGIFKDASLYVDGGAATAIQSIGGVEYLLGLGLVNVGSLKQNRVSEENVNLRNTLPSDGWSYPEHIGRDIKYFNNLSNVLNSNNKTIESEKGGAEVALKLIFIVTEPLSSLENEIINTIKHRHRSAKWVKVYILNSLPKGSLDALCNITSDEENLETSISKISMGKPFDLTGFQLSIQQGVLPDIAAEVSILSFDLYAKVISCTVNASGNSVTKFQSPSSFISIFTMCSELCCDIYPVTLSGLGLTGNGVDSPIQHVSDLDANNDLTGSYRAKLKHLGHSLVSFCKQLEYDVAEHCYTCGFTSKLIGNLIAHEASKQNEIGKFKEKATLILVDRTLDLVSPLLMGDVPLLQTLCTYLSSTLLYNTSGKYATDDGGMKDLSGVVDQNRSNSDFGSKVSRKLGTLTSLHAADIGASSLLQNICEQKESESIQIIFDRWNEIMERNEAENDKHIIEKLVADFESWCDLEPSDSNRDHRWISRAAEVQLVACICLALKKRMETGHTEMSYLDKSKYENEALSTNDGTNLLILIKMLVGSRNRHKDMYDILTLAVVMFSLVGCTPGIDCEVRYQFETYLTEVIDEMVNRNGNFPPQLAKLLTLSEASMLTTDVIMNRLKGVMKEVSEARMKLFKSNSNETLPLGPTSGGSYENDSLYVGNEYVPLITRIAEQIVQRGPQSPEVSPIQMHHAGETFSVEQTAMNFLKTGFNVLGLSSGKGSPKKSENNNTWIIFVVGGISGNEIQKLRGFLNSEALAGNTTLPRRVLLGSTELSCRDDLMDELFASKVNCVVKQEGDKPDQKDFANLFD